MSIPYSIEGVLSAWWFPWTLATIFCYVAFIYFKRRYEELITQVSLGASDEQDASSFLKEYIEAHSFERASTILGAKLLDTFEDDKVAHEAIKELIAAELASQSLPAKTANKIYTSVYSDDEEQPALDEHEDPVQSPDGAPVPPATCAQCSPPTLPTAGTTHSKEEPATPRPTHISFACSTPKERRRSTVADLVTTAIFQGSSITINPPSNTFSSLNSSPTTFFRTPFPFGSPRPSITTLPVESPGPFPWAKPDVSKKSNGSSISFNPKLDFGGVSSKTEQASWPQMPTIAEEIGAGLGLGISGVLCGDTRKQKKSAKRKRRQARKGARKGVAGVP